MIAAINDCGERREIENVKHNSKLLTQSWYVYWSVYNAEKKSIRDCGINGWSTLNYSGTVYIQYRITSHWKNDINHILNVLKMFQVNGKD